MASILPLNIRVLIVPAVIVFVAVSCRYTGMQYSSLTQVYNQSYAGRYTLNGGLIFTYNNNIIMSISTDAHTILRKSAEAIL